MLLEQVLGGVSIVGSVPSFGLEVTGLQYDSRCVRAGDLFFAFPGKRFDGTQFARQAIDKGAVAVVSELPPPSDFAGVWIQVEHGRRALSMACRNLFGPPERDLSIVGITGTNGKTTTAYLVDALLESAGLPTAIFGTIGNQIGSTLQKTSNTTPESLDLYLLFQQVRQAGASHIAMEVSSHALALARVYAIGFHTAIFTNLTQDHLDFHADMESYFQAKRLLFLANGAAAPQWAILNTDDPYSRRIDPPREVRVITYGLSPEAELRATSVEMGFEGIKFTAAFRGTSYPVQSPLLGHVNVYNILAACGAGISYGLDFDMIAKGIAKCKAVPGRFERVDEGQPFLFVVDYAHTDDALRNAITVARTLKPRRIITVFGCGGDRDRAKRPLMGMAAGEMSDYVVLTSDNPRSEDPLNIINDALVGLRRYDTPHSVEADRRRAIQRAVAEARPGDLVLLAGKGHEDYQILKEHTISFDDREVARQVLNEFGYRRQQG
jgi:UDP-N-acetylmuramoyl-L-alanyl-D-glutamate--2,6-diaminopimelate ligase